MTALQFDNKISLGHVISIITILAGGIWAYAAISARQEAIAADMVTVKADAQAREVRIRAVEIAQASQSSDLRAIQGGIARIEAQLEKLQPKP